MTVHHAMDEEGVIHYQRQITNGDVVRIRMTEWQRHMADANRTERIRAALWLVTFVSAMGLGVVAFGGGC